MPLGHSPISATAISSDLVMRSGTSFAAVTGTSGSLVLGSVVASGIVRGSSVVGLEATMPTPMISSVSGNGHITIFISTVDIDAVMGTLSSAAAESSAVLSGVSATVTLSNDYIANGLFVQAPSLLITSAVGVVGQVEHLRWMNITPSSSPGWAEIKVPVK